MSEPPSKRARMSTSPSRATSPNLNRRRSASPGDRFAISGPASASRNRPSVLASPSVGNADSRMSFATPSTPIRPGSSSQPYGQPQMTPSGYARRPGSPGSSSHTPLPSIGQMSGAWTSQVAGYESLGESSRMPEQGFTGRRESMSIISEGQESSDAGTVVSRDLGRERAPRSMMACVRCRKQKMKCDGPAAAPCRGCKSANVTCVFETRSRSSRPKSIASLSAVQPLPAIMSGVSGTGAPGGFGHQSSRSLDPYSSASVMGMAGPMSPTGRQVREAMPPPSAPAYTMPVDRTPVGYVPTGSSTAGQAPSPAPMPFSTPSGHRSSFSTSALDRTRAGSAFNNPPPVSSLTNPLTSPITPRPQTATSQTLFAVENRLRNLEASIRSVEGVQANHATLQTTLGYLEMQVRQLTGQVAAMSHLTSAASRSGKGKEPERQVYISEAAWEGYRSCITPLSPWLVILTSPHDLSGEVIASLGSRYRPDPTDTAMAPGDLARIQLGQLMTSGQEWTRNDIHAAGIFALWEASSSLACTVIGQAAARSAKYRGDIKGTMQEARGMIELVVLEHMLWSVRSPEFVPASVKTTLSAPWRERVRTNNPIQPGEKDNDIKMLAWLEYAEMLTEVQNGLMNPALYRRSAAGSPEQSRPVSLAELIERRKTYMANWDAWNGRWGGSGDPILNLHYHYAIALTTSPLLMPSATSNSDTTQISPTRSNFPGSAGSAGSAPAKNRWDEMVTDQSGFDMLSRGRDSAIEFVRGVCAPDIARTLHYSMTLFRTRLAFTIIHLLAHMIALPNSTLTPLSLLQSTIRLAYDRLSGPLSGTSFIWKGLGASSVLAEVVQSGELMGTGVGGLSGARNEVLRGVVDGRGVVGPELWDRVLGN